MSNQQVQPCPERMISGEVVAATDAAGLADCSLRLPAGLSVEFGPAGDLSSLLALALAVGNDHHAVFALASMERVIEHARKMSSR